MGHGIDKLALMSLLAGALYLFFVGAMGSVPLAAASAFFAMALIKKLSGRFPNDRPGRARRARSAAAAELEQLALSERESAENRIAQAIACAYPGQLDNAQLGFILRHPAGGKVTSADIIANWKEHRGCDRLVIAALPNADDGAFTLVERLSQPEIRLLDGSQLVGILAAHPVQARQSPLKPPKRIGRFAALSRAACRARAGKCALTGTFMCALFFITGAAVYLIGALALMFIAGVSLRERRRPGTLFG